MMFWLSNGISQSIQRKQSHYNHYAKIYYMHGSPEFGIFHDFMLF